MLIERGWLEAEETPEAPSDFKVMPETEAPITVEQMDITMPIPGWTVAQMTNLLRIVFFCMAVPFFLYDHIHTISFPSR